MNHQVTPKAIYLKDYQKPDYHVDKIDLYFNLDNTVTTVTANMALRRAGHAPNDAPLVLDGEDLVLKSIVLNDEILSEDLYERDESQLTLLLTPDKFNLKIVTEIKPQLNTKLFGLYKSGDLFCTQCESHGFRRITYYLDRPDVMSLFTTTIEADVNEYPVLLSNGNCIDRQTLESGRHRVTWQDPFKKPAYLFALVAGDLACIKDTFVTKSSREIALEIYVEPYHSHKCDHAMQSLKNAMRWDEETFGLEYDLDTYMIVAVNDFNQGAMENKGLNIFNDKYILASPDFATDADYEYIEAVVGHEYFHNYSGNRVTLRDWFQLSLKEGLTVYREQRFTESMFSSALKRIEQVMLLRAAQFPEDQGPLSHPVRPPSYIDMNNFYTMTVYEKGSELIRMMATLLGDKSFKEAMTLYFTRHDGQAVTTDDFVKAMQDPSGVDLEQFKLWYSQSGTPHLFVSSEYSQENYEWKLTIEQVNEATADQEAKQPLHIPFKFSLLDSRGARMPILEKDSTQPACDHKLLELKNRVQTFTFKEVAEEPVPSYLEGFTAPVRLTTDLRDEDRIFLAQHASDPFVKWDVVQQLIEKEFFNLYEQIKQSETPQISHDLIDLYEHLILDNEVESGLAALIMKLPLPIYFMEFLQHVEVEHFIAAHDALKHLIASACEEAFWKRYYALEDFDEYQHTQKAVGDRSLKHICLDYLATTKTDKVIDACMNEFKQTNMTDKLAGLKALCEIESSSTEQALEEFYFAYEKEPVVLDKWLRTQATSRSYGSFAHVKELSRHKIFDLNNPNKVHALLGAFASHNFRHFHQAQGETYAFITEQIIKLNKSNPMVASRLTQAFTHWRKFKGSYRLEQEKNLQMLAAEKNLSDELYEIVTKLLHV